MIACDYRTQKLARKGPASPKIFKPIPILKMHSHSLFLKLFNSDTSLVGKRFNLPHLNKININMNLSLCLMFCILRKERILEIIKIGFYFL